MNVDLLMFTASFFVLGYVLELSRPHGCEFALVHGLVHGCELMFVLGLVFIAVFC